MGVNIVGQFLENQEGRVSHGQIPSKGVWTFSEKLLKILKIFRGLYKQRVK